MFPQVVRGSDPITGQISQKMGSNDDGNTAANGWGSDPAYEQNPLEDLPKMFPQVVRGSDPIPGQISQKMGSNPEVMVSIKSRRALNLYPPHSTQSNLSKNRDVQHRRSFMPTGMEEGTDKKGYVPTPRQIGARPMAVGTQRIDYPIDIRIQRIGVRSMVVRLQCLGDNPDTETAHSYQWKMIKKCSGRGSD